jgi:hypothetical protein
MGREPRSGVGLYVLRWRLRDRLWIASGALLASSDASLEGHHSITSSARTSIDGGMVRPNVLAVLRSMTSSNCLGCSLGRSEGLAPLRMRSTKIATSRSANTGPYLINPRARAISPHSYIAATRRPTAASIIRWRSWHKRGEAGIRTASACSLLWPQRRTRGPPSQVGHDRVPSPTLSNVVAFHSTTPVHTYTRLDARLSVEEHRVGPAPPKVTFITPRQKTRATPIALVAGTAGGYDEAA